MTCFCMCIHVSQEVKAQMEALLKPEELQRYAVKGSEAEFAAAGANGRSVSIKSTGEAKRKEGGMLYQKKKKKKKVK